MNCSVVAHPVTKSANMTNTAVILIACIMESPLFNATKIMTAP